MRQSFDETTDPSFGAKHLPRVRARMAEQGLDGLLVPHEDEHQNEYLPPANDRLAWLTGFTGSAGAGAVLMDRAAVFADGRYTGPGPGGSGAVRDPRPRGRGGGLAGAGAEGGGDRL